MTKDYKYPTIYEIEEVFSSITNRSFLNDFAQRKGLFLINGTQQQLAIELSNLFYDDAELEKIRMEAYQNKANHTLSGFIVKSSQKDFDLKGIYEFIRENAKFEVGQSLTALQKVNKDESDLTYKGSVEYYKPKAGRMQFLQGETSSFEFFINKKADGVWQVEVDASRSNDIKELKNLISKNINKEYNTIELIEHDFLNTEQTIAFFDDLAGKGMDNNWTFLDTKHLTLKKGNEELDQDTSQDSEQVKEITEKADLLGITQAILQGKGLRENNFVR